MLDDGALSSVEAYSSGPIPTEPLFPQEWTEMVDEFYDDILGELRSQSSQRRNRVGAQDQALCDKVPRSQAIQRGKPILPVRWVDVNKGDNQKMNLRSR